MVFKHLNSIIGNSGKHLINNATGEQSNFYSGFAHGRVQPGGEAMKRFLRHGWKMPMLQQWGNNPGT